MTFEDVDGAVVEDIDGEGEWEERAVAEKDGTDDGECTAVLVAFNVESDETLARADVERDNVAEGDAENDGVRDGKGVAQAVAVGVRDERGDADAEAHGDEDKDGALEPLTEGDMVVRGVAVGLAAALEEVDGDDVDESLNVATALLDTGAVRVPVIDTLGDKLSTADTEIVLDAGSVACGDTVCAALRDGEFVETSLTVVVAVGVETPVAMDDALTRALFVAL